MTIFVELSLILAIATGIAGVMRVLKQPLIMGHIITGILVGPQLLNLTSTEETIETFAKIGVAVLLFIVGLGLSPKIIRDVGKIAVITGLGQIIFTSLIGFFLAKAFGYDTTSALYIAIALTFSSTIIILKLLSDKKATEKLYGRISIGFLLVQDLVATIILVFVSTFSSGENALSLAGLTLFKGLIITILLTLISMYVLPKLGDFFAKSQEFLFIFSIGWGLGMATLFHYVGFSIEIGALIAGVTLSVSPYNQEIAAKLKTLRDFFIIMFFVLLGMKMAVDSIVSLIPQAAAFSLFVLVGNPLIVMILMGLLGYNKKTGFLAGLTVAQISEFSLILVLLGISVGHINDRVLSLITIVGLLTIAGSTYLIIYSEKIYAYLSPYLSIFERKKPVKEFDILGSYDVVLFGCNRVGYDFLRIFKRLGQKFLVVDFDPEVIKELTRQGVNCRYGDAEDTEFLEELNLGETKLIISTIPDIEVNEYVLGKIKELNSEVTVILISSSIDDALSLYEKGANYVILPHFVGGHFAAALADKHWENHSELEQIKKVQIDYLNERKSLGHKHPHLAH
jgi:Kef-type K+ transport system membrane component KefB